MRVGLCALCVALAAFCMAAGAEAKEGASTTEESGRVAPADVELDEERSEAQQKFTAGLEHYDAGEFADAVRLFRQSLRMVPSPNSRLMVARALEKNGDVAEAYAEYEATLADAELAAANDEKYKHTAAAVREELHALRPRVALVVVEIEGLAPDDATLRVDGRTIERAHWGRPHPATPGEVVVVLTLPNADVHDSIDVAAGKTGKISMPVPAPAPAGEKGDDSGRQVRRTSAYISAGVGLAGIATFALLAVAEKSDDLQTAALVVGGLGIGAGVVLYFTSVPDSEGDTALVIGPGSVAVTGRF